MNSPTLIFKNGVDSILFKTGVANDKVLFQFPYTAFRVVPYGGDEKDYLYVDWENNLIDSKNTTTVTGLSRQESELKFLGGQRLSELTFGLEGVSSVGLDNQDVNISGFNENFNSLEKLEFFNCASSPPGFGHSHFQINFENFNAVSLKEAKFNDCGLSYVRVDGEHFILNNFPWQAAGSLTGLSIKSKALHDPEWDNYAQIPGLTTLDLSYGYLSNSSLNVSNIPFNSLKTLNLSPPEFGSFRLDNSEMFLGLQHLTISSTANYLGYNYFQINDSIGLAELTHLTLKDIGDLFTPVEINDTVHLFNLTDLTFDDVGAVSINNITNLTSLKNLNALNSNGFIIPTNKLHLLPNIENILFDNVTVDNYGLRFTGEFSSPNTNSITFKKLQPYYTNGGALKDINTSGLKNFKEIKFINCPDFYANTFSITNVGGFVNTPSLTISGCGLYHPFNDNYCTISDTGTLLSGAAALNIMNAVRTGNNRPGEIKLNINDPINTVDKSIYFDVYTGLREQGYFVNLYFTSGGITNPAIVARYSDNTQEFFKTGKIENVAGDIFSPFQIEQTVDDLFFENCGSSTFTLDYNPSGIYNQPTLLKQYNKSINFNNCGPDNFSILNTRFATFDSFIQTMTGFNFNNCGYNGSFNIQDTGDYPLSPARVCLLLSGIDNGTNLGTGTISFILNGTKNNCIVQSEQNLINKGFVVDISDDSHILEVQNNTGIIANYNIKSSPHVQISNLPGHVFKLYRGTGIQTLEFSGLSIYNGDPTDIQDYYSDMGLGNYRDTLTGLNFYEVGLWGNFYLNNTQTFSGAKEINFSSCGTYNFEITDISMFQNIDSVTFSSCAHYYGGFIINDTGHAISTSKAELILTGIGLDCGDSPSSVINLKLDTAPTQTLLDLETALESRTPANRKKINVNFYQ